MFEEDCVEVRVSQCIVCEMDGLRVLWDEGVNDSGEDTEFDIV